MILILTCGVLIFEGEEQDDRYLVVVLFGALLIIMVCFCVIFSFSSIIDVVRRRTRRDRLLITKGMFNSISQDLALELYFIMALNQLQQGNDCEFTIPEVKLQLSQNANFKKLNDALDHLLTNKNRPTHTLSVSSQEEGSTILGDMLSSHATETQLESYEKLFQELKGLFEHME
jgi:hypothetical protein